MARILALVVLVGGAAVGGYLWREANPPAGEAGRTAPVEQSVPGPGDPPVVWLSGTLSEVGRDELVLTQGDGPELRLQRFAAGATRFHVLRDGAWSALSRAEADAQAGKQACVETLMDGDSFLAVRVYLGARCTPQR